MNVTVVFPDTSLPTPTNGGFANQDEFRRFVTENQKSGQWNSALHARPLAERLADYKDDTVALAFPLQFPYGHTGLPRDPAVIQLSQRPGWRKHLKRRCKDVLQSFLTHRKTEFHTPMFNLILHSIMMKESAFLSTKIYCNAKYKDGSTMSTR